jgi:hypothetical protein
MKTTIKDILQTSFHTYARHNMLPLHQHRAAWHLQHCRTATLGGHIQSCPEGHIERVWYNSCKHRFCPQCNQLQIERWLEGQKARLLSCAHHHIIFTLPHELNDLWRYNRPRLMQGLFQTVRDTLMSLTADPRYLGATPGFMCALHTWGRSQVLHPHIHCLITDGGLDDTGHWQQPKKSCFLPARVVMHLFRGKYLAYVRQLLDKGQLNLPPDQSVQRIHNLLNKLGRKKWNVHLRERYEHGEGVVKYLARYVRGGPLKNAQLQSVSATQVRYRYYAHDQGQHTHLTLSHEAFLRRYLQHVPDKGKQLVRHYGLYAHRKTDILNSARAQLGQAPIKPPEPLNWQTYLVRLDRHEQVCCPVCGQILQPTRTLPRWRAPPIDA